MDEEKLEAGSGGWVGEGEGDFVQAGLGEGSLEGYGGGLPMEGSVAMDGQQATLSRPTRCDPCSGGDYDHDQIASTPCLQCGARGLDRPRACLHYLTLLWTQYCRNTNFDFPSFAEAVRLRD